MDRSHQFRAALGIGIGVVALWGGLAFVLVGPGCVDGTTPKCGADSGCAPQFDGAPYVPTDASPDDDAPTDAPTDAKKDAAKDAADDGATTGDAATDGAASDGATTNDGATDAAGDDGATDAASVTDDASDGA